eukprot:2826981-Pleurochrysis_carterae.AAC.1
MGVDMLRCRRCLQAACRHVDMNIFSWLRTQQTAAHKKKRALDLTSAVACACCEAGASTGGRGPPPPLTCLSLANVRTHEVDGHMSC